MIDTTAPRGGTPVQDSFAAELDPETGDPRVFTIGRYLFYPLDYEPSRRDEVTSPSLELAPVADR